MEKPLKTSWTSERRLVSCSALVHQNHIHQAAVHHRLWELQKQQFDTPQSSCLLLYQLSLRTTQSSSNSGRPPSDSSSVMIYDLHTRLRKQQHTHKHIISRHAGGGRGAALTGGDALHQSRQLLTGRLTGLMWANWRQRGPLSSEKPITGTSEQEE